MHVPLGAAQNHPVPNIQETLMLKPLLPHPGGAFSCCLTAVTSSAQREYVLVAGTANQTLSYRLRQNVTFAGCPYARLPAQQQLSVARAFALYDGQEHVLRYALAARVGSARGELQHPRWGAHPRVPALTGGCCSLLPTPKVAVCSICPKTAKREGLFSKQLS